MYAITSIRGGGATLSAVGGMRRSRPGRPCADVDRRANVDADRYRRSAAHGDARRYAYAYARAYSHAAADCYGYCPAHRRAHADARF